MGDVKLTDDGSNTLTFEVDSISENDMNYDYSSRSLNGTLKSYDIARKKKWILSVRNIAAASKDTLKTIYDLRESLSFYRDATGSKTATVSWTGNFNLHTPTRQSHQFLFKIYAGTIILEEV